MKPPLDIPTEPGRVRKVATAVFLVLATVFLYEVFAGFEEREVEDRRTLRMHVGRRILERYRRDAVAEPVDFTAPPAPPSSQPAAAPAASPPE
jgi:hypothetical protein